jgi:O-antigen/teichoic acid export membrane protein
LKNTDSVMVLVQRAWQAVAGIITLAFVAYFLSPAEQGYFYTLASIAALHMALDMGLSTILVQFASRKFVDLSWGLRGVVNGAKPSSFLALARMSWLWYGSAAVIFLMAYPAGSYFIASGQGDLAFDWRGPLALLVCATAVNFMFLPVLALTEGSGDVAEVYAVRLVQGVVGASAAWVLLVTGYGLYAVAMMPLGSAVIAAVWLFFRRRGLIAQALRQKLDGFQWGAEVWPLQWRIGASWLAGYALVLMHVPLLFRTQGPIAAGQMGVTMTVANMLSLLALSWMTAQLPAMARAVATKEWAQLDHIFWRACRLSCAAFATGAGMFVVVRWYLESTPYGVRFLPTEETVGLLFAMGFYHVSGLFAAYLRSHLQELFLWPSLFGAMVTAIAAIWVAPLWGAQGIVIVLLVVNGLFFSPAAVWMWVHYRSKWHALEN